MCKHELYDLVGTADGIECRKCGKVFKDFTEVEKDRKQAEKPAKKKKGAE